MMYNEQQDDEIEIDLMEVFHLFLKRWWMLLGCGLIAAVVVFGFNKIIVTPQYEASSMIYILSKTTSITSAIDLQLGKQLTVDFETLATSRPVVEKVIDELKLDMDYDEMVKKIEVSNPSETQILKIAVRDPDPELACDISNAMSDATAERVAEVMVTDKPSTVEDAVVPEYPVTPNTLKNTVVAGAFGVLLMMGILLVNYLVDDRIKTEDDVAKYLELNTLASIPVTKGEKKAARRKKGDGKRVA